MRPKLSLKILNNRRALVTERECWVDKDLILPHDGEERNLGRVKEHRAVPAGHVIFPH